MQESFQFAGFTFPRRLPLISRMEAREPARRDSMGGIMPRRMRAVWCFAYWQAFEQPGRGDYSDGYREGWQA